MLPFSVYSKEYSGKLTGRFATSSQEINYNGQEVNVFFDAELTWKMWTLFNEPVIDSRLKWKLRFVKVTSRDEQGKILSVNSYAPCMFKKQSDCIPDSVAKEISLYNVAFLVRTKEFGSQTFNDHYILIDPGAISKPAVNEELTEAEESFNSPGSPDWNELFIKHGAAYGINGSQKIKYSELEYFDEQTSKEKFTKGVKLKYIELAKATVGYSALLEYLYEKEHEKVMREIDSEQDLAIKEAKSNNNDDIFADFETEALIETSKVTKKTATADFNEKNSQDIKSIKYLKKQEKKLRAEDVSRVNALYLPSNELTVFYKNGKEGFKNESGKIIIPAQYHDVQNFSEGLAAVSISDHKWGFINFKNEYVIKPQFRYATSFINGLSTVKSNYRIKELNTKGCPKYKELWDEYTIDKLGRKHGNKIQKTNIYSELCLGGG